jgi:hypothetical protein
LVARPGGRRLPPAATTAAAITTIDCAIAITGCFLTNISNVILPISRRQPL